MLRGARRARLGSLAVDRDTMTGSHLFEKLDGLDWELDRNSNIVGFQDRTRLAKLAAGRVSELPIYCRSAHLHRV